MENYHSYSHRLLYSIEPLYIASLHLLDEENEVVVWNETSSNDGNTLKNAFLKLLGMDNTK